MKHEVLGRITSDHHPIISDTNAVKWGLTPFKFENMWLQHKDFKGKISEMVASKVISRVRLAIRS